MIDFFDFIKKQNANTTTNGMAPPQAPIPTPMQNVPVMPQPPVQGSPVVPVAPPAPAAAPPETIVQAPVVGLPPAAAVNPPAKPDGMTAPVKPEVKPPTGAVAQTPAKTDPAKAASDKKESFDLMTHLTQRSNRVFLSATTKAKELGSEFVDSEHILHGLVADSEIYNFLVELKIQPQLVEQELASLYKRNPGPASAKPPTPSPRVKRILDNSLVAARKLGFEFISPEHLLLALYEEGEGAGARVLAKLGLKKEDLNKKLPARKKD